MADKKDQLADDLDSLFALPLSEFIAARNALAVRLKKDSRADEAARVKALAKPPVSAWAVNQLFLKHRAEFDNLIATGQRFRQAQAQQLAGKAADLREPLEARREAVSRLSHLAAELLRDAGHNPTSDMIRRIATTLEAASANASLPDAPQPGRLTADMDPPGFDSLAAAFAPAPPRKASTAAAKVELQNAELALREARERAQGAEAALKRAAADEKELEKRKREVEEKLERTAAALEEARGRGRAAAIEVEEAAKAVEEAARAVEKLGKMGT
jgi:hypothetical protein